ncbi:MAG TPA: thioredoxin [Spirochaetia bacterium]|nr:thioredoxin [Spirochaetia bacterium]
MSYVVLTDDNFDNEVLTSELPVLVDFWAPWCGPCRIQGPIIEDLASEIDASKAKVGKLNVDEASSVASHYGILSIPTLAIFKAGQVVEHFVGVQAKETLKSALEKHLA